MVMVMYVEGFNGFVVGIAGRVFVFVVNGRSGTVGSLLLR
jgi:hypothetical protein